MDALSDEQRFCVLMYYVEEHSVREIAQIIGCPENTVKSRLNYGRKNLKAKAEEMERKGYRLYGIAALPLLLWLMRTEARAASDSISSAHTAAGAARAGAGAGGMSTSVRIALAVLAVAVLGGAGFAVSKFFSSSPAEEIKDREDRRIPEEEPEDGDIDTDTDKDDFFKARSLIDEIELALAEWEEGQDDAIGQDWSGLYSGSDQGRYYYVWLEKDPDAAFDEPQGTIRLLWEGDRPYEEGDDLLTDAPHDIYNGELLLTYRIRPGWDGEEYSIITIGSEDDPEDDYVPVNCFGFWMERDDSLMFDGTNLMKR